MSIATSHNASEPGFVRWLNDNRKGSGMTLLVVGLVVVAVAMGANAWYNHRYGPKPAEAAKPESKPDEPAETTSTASATNTGLIAFHGPTQATLFFFGFACGAVLAGVGLYQLWSERPFGDRIGGWAGMLASVGGVGACVYLLGMSLLLARSADLNRLLSEGARDQAWSVLQSLGAIVVGLMIMFAAVLAVRGEVRRSALLRRAVFGYNAFLTGFLVLSILIVVNVLAHAKLSAAVDATRSGQFSLSPRTAELLKQIDTPTKVYILLRGGDTIESVEMRTFFSVCRERTSKLIVESVVAAEDPDQARALLSKYPQIASDFQGVLIVYGDEKPENSRFIPMRDIVTRDFPPGAREAVLKFQGEAKFAAELSYLMGGKETPTVYFTQGMGEFDLNDSSGNDGLGTLREKLKQRNIEVQAAPLRRATPKLPEGAKYLVIAGAAVDYPPEVAAEIEKFLRSGGRLIALLDVPDSREKSMPPTGLEQVLAGFGVSVTRDRLLSASTGAKDTEIALVRAARESADNPVAGVIGTRARRFDRCRVIRPTSQSPNPAIKATPLLVVSENFDIWAEPDLQANGRQIVETMKSTGDVSRLSADPLPIAVAVTESPPPNPMARERVDATPKLIVVGDASFAGNVFQSNQAPGVYFDLFVAMVEWLRDKPANIGVEPRKYDIFEVQSDVVNRAGRLVWLPLLAAVVTVAGLGASVWVARRR